MTFNIGRGHEAEVRVNDISVSRCHAMIKYVPELGFYIEDNLSKFGTIVSLKEPYRIKQGQKVSFQIGRTIIHTSCKQIEVSHIRIADDVNTLIDRSKVSTPRISSGIKI